MKKILSLLAVALFATVFAAGCGKHTKCSDATTKEECKEEKFEKGKFTCDFKADPADNNKEKCMDKPPAYTVLPADEKICSDIAAPAAKGDCDAVTPNLTPNAKANGYTCFYTAGQACKLKN